MEADIARVEIEEDGERMGVIRWELLNDLVDLDFWVPDQCRSSKMLIMPPVNIPNGRADGQGHVSLESKNSTKYKKYLDLLLRWIWHAPLAFGFLTTFDVSGNDLLLLRYVSWDTVLSVSSFLTFFCHLADSMCFTNHVSNWWNFFCCLFPFSLIHLGLAFLPPFSRIETDF